jgi:hypothetical protein
LFHAAHLLAEDKLRGIDNAREGGQNFVAQRRGLRSQVEKPDLSQLLCGGLPHAAESRVFKRVNREDSTVSLSLA